jgi:hypothetical protein
MIYGLTGAVGSGKDTVAQYLVDHYGFKKVSFAKKVKDVAHLVFGWDRAMLEGCTRESREWREVVDPYWGVSPRAALQKIGTEMFRDHIHPETWVKAVIKEIGDELSVNPTCNFVITDCRFENEVRAVHALGGRVVGIQRGAEPPWAALAREGAPCVEGVHSTDWNVYRLYALADVRLHNDGTIEDLHDEIERMLLL